MRTPKVLRLLDKTGRRALSISFEVLWSAMRLGIAFRVGSHFLHNLCANADAYSDGHAHSRCDANAECNGKLDPDTGIVYIV